MRLFLLELLNEAFIIPGVTTALFPLMASHGRLTFTPKAIKSARSTKERKKEVESKYN
jgi:hypothetical protein